MKVETNDLCMILPWYLCPSASFALCLISRGAKRFGSEAVNVSSASVQRIEICFTYIWSDYKSSRIQLMAVARRLLQYETKICPCLSLHFG